MKVDDVKLCRDCCYCCFNVTKDYASVCNYDNINSVGIDLVGGSKIIEKREGMLCKEMRGSECGVGAKYFKKKSFLKKLKTNIFIIFNKYPIFLVLFVIFIPLFFVISLFVPNFFNSIFIDDDY